ncbi:MAG: phosphotransferase, partial [Chloroflexota bacterium]|nr:phosphotransferase [Chloroflexota bacterium]
MRTPESPSWLNATHLVEPVGAITGGKTVVIDAWSCQSLDGGAGEALGVSRVTGEALVDGVVTPFTVILKGWPAMTGPGDPTDWNWPQREVCAYTSGELDALPGGIRAPRCIGEINRPDGSTWIWLSPMSDGALETWELEHFTLVARHLGQFNGAYLAGQPVPDVPWLSRRWTRQWVELSDQAIIEFSELPSHPITDRVLSPAVKAGFQRIWDERHAWLDTIEALPQTFCHLDAFKRNIFLRLGPTGNLEPGLIDWGFTGIATVGEEIAPLVVASLYFSEALGIQPQVLDATVFDSYVQGLQEAGWHGDGTLVRTAYVGSSVLRYGVGPMRLILPALLDETAYPMLEQVFRLPIVDLAELHGGLNLWLVDLADE